MKKQDQAKVITLTPDNPYPLTLQQFDTPNVFLGRIGKDVSIQIRDKEIPVLIEALQALGNDT